MESWPLRRSGRTIRDLTDMSHLESRARVWRQARYQTRAHSVSPPSSPCLQWRRRVTGHFRSRNRIAVPNPGYLADLNVAVRQLSLTPPCSENEERPDQNVAAHQLSLIPTSIPTPPCSGEEEEEGEDDNLNERNLIEPNPTLPNPTRLSPILEEIFISDDELRFHLEEDDDNDDDDGNGNQLNDNAVTV